VAEITRRRPWVRGILLTGIALALVALAFLFGAANGPQPIRLTFGILAWRGEAVHALFAAFVAGLLAMFLVGLSTDLAARAERRRLESRIARLERDVVRPRREPPEASEFARRLRNPGDRGAI
jgi:hypothetical protein